MADPAPQMAAGAPPAETGQPKAVLNYRRGGDHCGLCMHFSGAEGGKGTCPQVIPHDVDASDVCDSFKPAARERAQQEQAAPAPTETSMMVDNLQRRGMISDKAMAGLRGGA